ncbi:MAG: hypothetical protein RIE73_17465 [Coleofasciculus sp. C1-SOL-03]|uniref:hypothetical protein n=1 Tax=Coleofasciculus sp. C1-SOL-03 TaxID=3069522 RepID=UPI0032FA2E31
MLISYSDLPDAVETGALVRAGLVTYGSKINDNCETRPYTQLYNWQREGSYLIAH